MENKNIWLVTGTCNKCGTILCKTGKCYICPLCGAYDTQGEAIEEEEL